MAQNDEESVNDFFLKFQGKYLTVFNTCRNTKDTIL